jgi:hypothetical protein
MRGAFDFRVFEPEPEDMYLTKIPGCFARLRMFDRQWQRARGLDGPVVCLDLDLVATGPLDDLFAGDEPFKILGGANAANPCPFNGSVLMFQAGYRRDIWEDFSLAAAAKIPKYEFADDQGWYWHKVPDAATWPAGVLSGIYAFRKPGWPGGDGLPKGAKIVCFPGSRDPEKFVDMPWVRQHWLGDGRR